MGACCLWDHRRHIISNVASPIVTDMRLSSGAQKEFLVVPHAKLFTVNRVAFAFSKDRLPWARRYGLRGEGQHALAGDVVQRMMTGRSQLSQ